jgi:predicted ribosomally synthesized peptide with SipW-like signal peptide
MNKQILLSILVISAAVALVSGATLAYFSDTENSLGNLFQAGELDLKVDNTCHFDGMICEDGFWVEEQTDSSTYPELIGKPCDCTWLPTDLINEKFFAFDDVKPGDNGEDTISLHVANDAWLCASVYNLENKENDCNEPEDLEDTSCNNPGIGEGELQKYLLFTVWRDTNCNNVLEEPDEKVLVRDHVAGGGAWPIADSTTGTGPLLANVEYCIGVKWEIDPAVGNEIQGDSLKGDIKFWTVQHRNNPDFVCNYHVRYPLTGNAYIGYEDWPNGDFDYNDFGMTFEADEIYNQDWNLAEVTMTFNGVIYDSGADHYVHIKRPFVGTYTYTVTRFTSDYTGETPAGTYTGSGDLDVVLYNTVKYAWPQKHIDEKVIVNVVLDNPELNPKQVLTPPRSMINNGNTIVDLDPFMANYDPWLHDYAGVSGTFHITDVEHVTSVTGAHTNVLDTRFVGMNLPHILVVPHTDWIPPYEDTSISRPDQKYQAGGDWDGPYDDFYEYYWNGSPASWYDTVTNSFVGLGGISWA